MHLPKGNTILMSRFCLYHTAGCHLCEEAEELLAACFLAEAIMPVDFVKIDIADSDALLERYGVLIPVLREENSGRELRWPFSAEDVRQFLQDFGGT